MQLSKLYLSNFRNYSSVDLELHPGITGIYGANGQGKTNILEAIHMITQGYSQRTRKVSDLLRWEQDLMMLRAEGSLKGIDKKVALSLDKRGQKDVRVDGGNYKLFSKLLGSFATLSIGPSDIAIIQEGPAERRKYLDSLGCQFSSSYMESLKQFNQILKQRNAFLKNGHQVSDDLWESISQTYLKYAVELILRRLKLVQGITSEILNSYEKISSGAEELSFEYHVNIGMHLSHELLSQTDVQELKEEIQALFWQKLCERKTREKDLKMSLYGPHKDDLVFHLKHKSLREFGSQGQQRSTALALKLAASQLLEDEFQAPPILLLDDIFSELDSNRRKALSERILSSQQVFVATPEIGDLPFETHQTLKVHQGSLQIIK